MASGRRGPSPAGTVLKTISAGALPGKLLSAHLAGETAVGRAYARLIVFVLIRRPVTTMRSAALPIGWQAVSTTF